MADDDMMKEEIEKLEAKTKNMEKLVAQRRQERADLDAENLRMQRKLKYMKEEVEWLNEVEDEIHHSIGLSICPSAFEFVF